MSSAGSAFFALSLCIPVVWGLNYIVIKDALPAFASPLAFTALRWILAAGVLTALAGARREPVWVRRDDWGRVLLLAAVGNVGQQLTFIYGIRLTTAGHSALLMGLVPVMVASAAVVSGAERVDRRTWAGIVLSIAGLALLVRPGAAGLPAGAVWGDLLTLASAGCWAVYTVRIRPLVLRYPSSTVTVAGVLPATAVLVALGWPDLAAQSWRAVPWGAWGGLVYSGALAIAFNYAVWSVAVTRIGTARTSLLANLSPVIALAAAWVFLGERLDAAQVLGAALVIVGIALARR